MNDYLLVDCVGSVGISLNESTSNGSSTRFGGVFQEAEKPNKNKRVYPRMVLENGVQKLNESIKNRGLFGELDHPTDTIIHLANASHLVTRLWWEGNTLMGEGEVLNTPAGKVLKSLLESGLRVGMSSRGVGSGNPDSNGLLVIGESYKLITFDAVADPSTFSAFQKKISNAKQESYVPEVKKELNENLLLSYFGKLLEEKVAEYKKLI